MKFAHSVRTTSPVTCSRVVDDRLAKVNVSGSYTGKVYEVQIVFQTDGQGNAIRNLKTEFEVSKAFLPENIKKNPVICEENRILYEYPWGTLSAGLSKNRDQEYVGGYISIRYQT